MASSSGLARTAFRSRRTDRITPGGHLTLPDEGLVELLGGANGALKHVRLLLLSCMAGDHRQAVFQPLYEAIFDQRLAVCIAPDPRSSLPSCLKLAGLLLQPMQIQPLRKQCLSVHG